MFLSPPKGSYNLLILSLLGRRRYIAGRKWMVLRVMKALNEEEVFGEGEIG